MFSLQVKYRNLTPIYVSLFSSWSFSSRLSAPAGVPGSLVSPAPPVGYMRQKENPGSEPLCCFLDVKGLLSVWLLLPPSRVYLCLCYIRFPGFLAILRKKNGEMYSYFIFLEVEVLCFVF